MGTLGNFGSEPEDIIGTIRYYPLQYTTALVEAEFALDNDVYS